MCHPNNHPGRCVMQNLQKVQKCVELISTLIPKEKRPKIGIVLGTGLGDFAEAAENKHIVPYAKLPDFPQSTVASHAGCFVFGEIAGVPVVMQQGRCHLYEGYSASDVCMGVRVMASLGIKALIVTNASGALNPQFPIGNIMLIEDQINMTGVSPLTGMNVDAWGVKFPDMSEPYDFALSRIVEDTALEIGLRLEKGVYIGTQGPQFDTRAETRMQRMMGADAVGMSTVLEVIAAHHMGIRVVGLSNLTNKNLPDCLAKVTLEEIIEVGKKMGEDLARLLSASLPRIVAQLE